MTVSCVMSHVVGMEHYVKTRTSGRNGTSMEAITYIGGCLFLFLICFQYWQCTLTVMLVLLALHCFFLKIENSYLYESTAGCI